MSESGLPPRTRPCSSSLLLFLILLLLTVQAFESKSMNKIKKKRSSTWRPPAQLGSFAPEPQTANRTRTPAKPE